MVDNYFEILRKIYIIPKYIQRELVNHRGFSLGKLNCCIKVMSLKGFIKLKILI